MTIHRTASVLLFLLLVAVVPSTGEAHDDHTGHKALSKEGSTNVKEGAYAVPAVTLIDRSGRDVTLKALVTSGKPVVLDFIFATCTTICPVLTATLSNFQDRLGVAADTPQLISITIDPEHDSPEILSSYADRFGAGEGWAFLTGSRRDIDRVLRRFGVFEPDKMNHRPVIFLKPATGDTWKRVEGLIGVDDLVRLYRAVAPAGVASP